MNRDAWTNPPDSRTPSDMSGHLDKLEALADERDRLDERRREIADEIRAIVLEAREAGESMTRMAETVRISRVALYKALEVGQSRTQR